MRARPVEAPVEAPVAAPPPEPAPEPAGPVHEEIVPGPPAGAAPELSVTVLDDEPGRNRLLVGGWVLLVCAGLAALVATMVPVGPSWLDGIGAVTVVSAYSWGLAARTGGRPVVFGCWRWPSAWWFWPWTRTTCAPGPR